VTTQVADSKLPPVDSKALEKTLTATAFFHNLTLLFIIIWPSILLVTYENVFYNPARLEVPTISWIIVATAPIICVALIMFWSAGRGVSLGVFVTEILISSLFPYDFKDC
jgi:hypothetical protein